MWEDPAVAVPGVQEERAAGTQVEAAAVGALVVSRQEVDLAVEMMVILRLSRSTSPAKG